MSDEQAQAGGTDTAGLDAKRIDPQSSAPAITTEIVQAEPNPLSYGELKKREGVHEFTLTRTADDPRGKVRFLELHGGRFKMERGKSRLFRFSLPAEARVLSTLAEDGYTVAEGGPPDPEASQAPEPELADAFANPEEIAPQGAAQSESQAIPAKTRKPKQTEAPEG